MPQGTPPPRRPNRTDAPPQQAIFVCDSEGKVDINVVGIDGFTNGYILKTSKRGALKKLESGDSPAEVFGRAAKFVSFDSIESLKWHSNENVVDVRSDDGKTVTAMFVSQDERGEFIDCLASSMGGQLHKSLDDVDAMTATMPAIITGGGTILVTVLAAYFLGDVDLNEVSGRKGKRGAVRMLQSLGTNGILVIGGIVLAGAVAFGIYRLRHRPQEHVLRRSRK